MVEAEKGAGWLSEDYGASEEMAELAVEAAEDVTGAEAKADAPLASSGREKGGGYSADELSGLTPIEHDQTAQKGADDR